MKNFRRVMLIALCISLYSQLFSQNIPNAGFEDWVTTGFPSYQDPDKWGTLNGSTSILSIYTTVKATGADVHSGTGAIKLISRYISFAGATAPGMATTGTINTSTQSISGGFSYTQRPYALTGWYKANPQQGDNGSIEAIFWKRVGGAEEIIGTAELQIFTPVTTYSRFVIPIDYTSANTPDSARIILFSSNGANAVENSELIVDDLEFVFCPTISVATTDETANGAQDGTASVTVSGGATPFTYLWSNNETSQSISGLSSGNYCVTVTDDNGCTVSVCGIVSSPSCTGFSVAVNTTDITYLGNDDGTATAVVTGGSSPFTYDWSNGATPEDIQNLSPGNYCVTVTDAANCFVTACGNVADVDCATLDVNITVINASSASASDGSASANATGGSSPYNYLWNTGATLQAISGLPVGNYCVTVTDNNGCTVSECADVDAPVGVSNYFNSNQVKLFPNPVSNELTVVLADNGNLTFNIFDLSGRNIFSEKLNNKETSINTSVLEKGIYLYQIRNENDGTIFNGKIVKQ